MALINITKLQGLADGRLYDTLVEEMWPPNHQPDLLTVKLLDVRGTTYNQLYNWANIEFQANTKVSHF